MLFCSHGGGWSAQPPTPPPCRPPQHSRPRGSADPLWMQTPWSWADPPPQYGQQAGSTHPTGMHTCCLLILLVKHNFVFQFYSITVYKVGRSDRIRRFRTKNSIESEEADTGFWGGGLGVFQHLKPKVYHVVKQNPTSRSKPLWPGCTTLAFFFL